ncbi:hypothetical protein UVI_02025140 [Ustilaginoidea virens]|nr:hypothetical protein UVI_02025140 [Ustilaginoidea virens]
MHPSRYHSSTGEPSSALRLGFSDIPKDGRTPGGQDGTPSKANRLPTSSFTFQIAREAASAELSSDARRMLDEIRDQAAKIKAELVAQREAEGGAKVENRPFAKPKGKVGRFSAAHMAEFKKMDSIQGHASAWRAQEGRFTPVKSLKRTPSKANLDATPASQKTDAKASVQDTPDSRPKLSLKRKSSAANLDGQRDCQAAPKRQNSNATPAKFSASTTSIPAPSSAAKRFKQRQEDDAATTRPKSLHACPSRPDSVFSRLASPKKAPTAASAASATKSYGKLAVKPKASLAQPPANVHPSTLSKSCSMASLTSTASQAAELRRRIVSPASFSRVKSILRGNKNAAENGTSAIPAPQASQTPQAPRVSKELPPIALTTPRRTLTKRVTFTPDVVMAVNSPSPQQRSSLFKLRPALKTIETHYAGLDDVLAESKSSSHSLYPDLSPLKHLIDTQSRRPFSASPSRPGTFTFRSDHTINFGGDTGSSGFGASPGQSSVRHVSEPAFSSNIPGTFPAPTSPSSHPNKENTAPSSVKLLPGTAHGMQNKKRHRATLDEDDFADGRAAKKRKNENVPEGQELLAPRLVKAEPASARKASRFGRTPTRTAISRTPAARTPGRPAATASPTKKSAGLSMSRLNMLARPKNRV